MHPIQEFLLDKVGVPAIASFVWWTAIFQYAGAIWAGFRDKSHNIPIAVSCFFFAHDVTYIILGLPGRWSFLVWIAGHLCVTYQIIAYSRKELGIGNTWLQALGTYAIIQTGMAILVLWMKDLMNDTTHAKLIGVMFVICQLFLIPMLMSRGSRKGQSLLTAWMLLLQAASYFFILRPLQAPEMGTPIFYLAGVATTLLSAVYLWMLYHAPRYNAGSIEREDSSTLIPVGGAVS